MSKNRFVFLLVTIVTLALQWAGTGCANMIPPGGGPRDTLAPRLLTALPKDSAVNVKTNRIVLNFDEYIDGKDLQQQLIVSPLLSNLPTIDYKLRTVTIKLRDSLEPNTTYSFNFGNALKDVNEGNNLPGFTYVFSTGNAIDNNTFSGKVLLAQNGKVDSTLLVLLHSNLNDTAIVKTNPRYYTKLKGDGSFTFRFLPKGQFNVFVIENEYYKRYTDSTKLFAFLNSPVTIGQDSSSRVTLYAYREAEKKAPSTPAPANNTNNKEDKRLKYSNDLESGNKDILKGITFSFNRKLGSADSSKIILYDTNYKVISGYQVHLDSTKTRLHFTFNWKPDTEYRLLIQKDAVADTAGVTLTKADTLKFVTRKESEYGSVKIRFSNLNLSQNPVLQIVKGEDIITATPITGKEWNQRLFPPGEYELRILYDDNKNGVWDAGNYKLKKQPEHVRLLTKKLSVRANWDNENEIAL